MQSRHRLVGLVLGMLGVAAACAPAPPPVYPNWVTSGLQRTGGTTIVNYVGAWTSETWFSTLRLTSPSGGPITADLLFFPRSGAGNSVLGSPQVIPITIDVGILGPMGAGDLVMLAGSTTLQFFELDAGVWAPAGTSPMPANRFVGAATDRWIAFRPGLPPTSGVDSSVLVYGIDRSGPTVTASAATTLPPDPAWPADLRESFGNTIALDGDLLVADARSASAPTPPAGRVFRATAGVWAPVVSVGGVPGGPVQIGQGVAVDDGATVDRVAVQTRATDTSPITVEVYADSGAGFVPEQSLALGAGLTDTSGGLYYGSTIALDGSLLAVTSRLAEVPSSQVGHTPVRVGYVQMYRRGSTWVPEAEVLVATNPAAAGITTTAPSRLMAVGNHVASTSFVSPDPPPGCMPIYCFNLGFEAWSIDRTN